MTKEKAKRQARILITIVMMPVVIFAPYYLGSLGVRIIGSAYQPACDTLLLRWVIGVVICGVGFLVGVLILDCVVSLIQWITGRKVSWWTMDM